MEIQNTLATLEKFKHSMLDLWHIFIIIILFFACFVALTNSLAPVSLRTSSFATYVAPKALVWGSLGFICHGILKYPIFDSSIPSHQSTTTKFSWFDSPPPSDQGYGLCCWCGPMARKGQGLRHASRPLYRKRVTSIDKRMWIADVHLGCI